MSEALCPICTARVELVDGVVLAHMNKRLRDNSKLLETYKKLEISTDCIGVGMSAKGLRNVNFGTQFGAGKEKLAKLALQSQDSLALLRSVLAVMLKSGWAVSKLDEHRNAYNSVYEVIERLLIEAA